MAVKLNFIALNEKRGCMECDDRSTLILRSRLLFNVCLKCILIFLALHSDPQSEHSHQHRFQNINWYNSVKLLADAVYETKLYENSE